MTEREWQRQTEAALARLEGFLSSGQVTVVIDQTTGAMAFKGWTTGRDCLSDVCAYRKLKLKGSFALNQAVGRAEMQAGRKVNEMAVAAGTHSHDGGATWSGGQ